MMLKCLQLVQDMYTKPLTSIQCWHVHCEECWLRTLVCWHFHVHSFLFLCQYLKYFWYWLGTYFVAKCRFYILNNVWFIKLGNLWKFHGKVDALETDCSVQWTLSLKTEWDRTITYSNWMWCIQQIVLYFW